MTSNITLWGLVRAEVYPPPFSRFTVGDKNVECLSAIHCQFATLTYFKQILQEICLGYPALNRVPIPPASIIPSVLPILFHLLIN